MMVRCVVPPHRILLTCGSLLAKRQFERIFGLFADPKPPAEVNVTWSGYQDNVIARRSTDRHEGRKLLDAAIDALSSELPAGLVELKRLGRTLWRRSRPMRGPTAPERRTRRRNRSTAGLSI